MKNICKNIVCLLENSNYTSNYYKFYFICDVYAWIKGICVYVSACVCQCTMYVLEHM